MYRGIGDINGQIWIGNQLRNDAANVGASHVGARSKRKHLHATGAGGRPVDMGLLITIVQIVKDLLGSLNPVRLFKRDYRASFRDLWRQEPRVFRIAYVLGMLCLLVLLALVGHGDCVGLRCRSPATRRPRPSCPWCRSRRATST